MFHGIRTHGRRGKYLLYCAEYELKSHHHRFSLNYKGIPYKTEWVEYPDIEAVCKKVGAAPTDTKPDGRPHYTLPIIYDPSTGAVVSESARIAIYLDTAYPDTVPLFPRGSRPLQLAFLADYLKLMDPFWQFVLPATNMILNPKSEKYFRPTREAWFFGGAKLEDVVPQGEKRQVEWIKGKDAMGKLYEALEAGKADGPYIMGETPCFADFAIGAAFIWIKHIVGEGSEEWKDIKTWHNGRWVAYMESLSKYTVTP